MKTTKENNFPPLNKEEKELIEKMESPKAVQSYQKRTNSDIFTAKYMIYGKMTD